MSEKSTPISDSTIPLSIFSELSAEHQQQIISLSTNISIDAGQTLLTEGEPANNLYFLIQGRLIVFSGEKPIAEISAGEPIGEIAFLTGTTRTATVIASRKSQLLELNKSAYTSLIKDIPEITESIVKTLADRLISSNQNIPTLEPKQNDVIAILPAADGIISDNFIQKLLFSKNQFNSTWELIDSSALDSVEQLSEWIRNHEKPTKQLILLAKNTTEKPEIAIAMSQHADKVFLILDKTQEHEFSISSLEEMVYENSIFKNVELVILRQNDSIKITNTKSLLSKRPISLHHHIALNHLPDIERLQRFISGEALGLVLCGGGAFGSAHLGMIKALQEQGFYFDMIGGTSVGSAMAALYTLGYAPNEALSKLEDMFIKKKALAKYSIPLYSFIDHLHFDNAVKDAARDVDIEDLPINYFALATNLSQNSLEIIRNGPVWQAVRSSCSIPGVLPPYINENKDVLIDGAVMDNTPIRTMRSLKSGSNIIMNFKPSDTWKVNSDYEGLPRGWALLKQIVLPKQKNRKYYPTIFSVLSRTMVTNTAKRFSEIDKKNDVFLEPNRLQKMGMMNWKKARQQFEMSYQQMNDALHHIDSDLEGDKIDVLRKVAQTMKINNKESK